MIINLVLDPGNDSATRRWDDRKGEASRGKDQCWTAVAA